MDRDRTGAVEFIQETLESDSYYLRGIYCKVPKLSFRLATERSYMVFPSLRRLSVAIPEDLPLLNQQSIRDTSALVRATNRCRFELSGVRPATFEIGLPSNHLIPTQRRLHPRNASHDSNHLLRSSS